MKILNIYFKNINSLEGESRIRFDQTPLVDGGVFAITGPNGSGKSSILDVITLGLYGETFRFDRPADHVMTKFTAESFAEVEFSLGANKFRSSWQVERKGGDADGELTTPKMKLLQLNGSEQILEDNAQKVRERMTELTGMDFHKFCKSMVLAQGDFAAFLNALDNERMDILEKISGVDIYADYKNQVKEKNTQAQVRVKQLEQDISAIPVMDEATREASEHDLADFEQQQVEYTQEQQQIEQQLVSIQNRADLKTQLTTLSDKQLQAESKLEENKQNLERIETSQDAIQFQDELSVVDTKIEQVEQGNKTLDSYRNELEILQKQLKSSDFNENIEGQGKTLAEQKNSIDELKLKFTELKSDLPRETNLLQSLNQQMEEKKSLQTSTLAWLEEHASDQSLLESFPETTQLIKLRAELVELGKNQKAQTQQSKSTTAAISKKNSKKNTLQKKNIELKAQIKSGENSLEAMAEGNSAEDLLEMQTEQQERVVDFLELLDLAGVNAKLGKKGFFGQLFQAKSVDKTVKQLKTEAEQFQLKVGKEKNIVKTLEQAVENEKLLKKMQADRQHLHDGKPCPLCGSLKHPYAKKQPAHINSKNALSDQKKKVKALLSESSSLSKQITLTAEKDVKSEKKDEKLLQINSQWNRLANRLNVVNMDLTIDKLSSMKDLLKTEKIELANITRLIKKYTRQQNVISEADSTIELNDVTLERLKQEIETLNTAKNTTPQESEGLQYAYSQCQEQEKALAEKVQKQLNLLGEKMPVKSKSDALFERLNTRKQECQMRVVRKKALAEEIQTLQDKIATCSSKVGEINNNIQHSEQLVQKEEMAGLHLSLIEKQKLIAEKEKEVSQQQTELSTSKQSLLDKTQESGQNDINKLRETIALVQRQPEIQQNQQELTQSIAEITSKLQAVQSQIMQEEASELSQKNEEALLLEQKSIKEKLTIAKQEIETIQNKLNKQEDLQVKYQQVMAKLASQKAEVEVCEADMKLISDQNNLQFRRKVQQLMVDKLLSKTNQILEKISGRYYLRDFSSDSGLALEIEDTKQHNVRRLPKTLSGGESFIVSLALALGLAEMANNGHAVDSLFLDEGFGNLDAESLYLALTTLESLKTHGKVVGIISHVEGVRKRIKTHIEMIKKPNGLSAIKMVS